MIQHDYDKLLQTAIDALNSRLRYSFSRDNIILRLFTAKNGKNVYDALVAEYGFAGEDVTEEYFQTIIGEAFAYGKRRDDEIAGILLREDLNLSDHEVFHILLHELSHIFCTREEIDGGCFYKRFCMGKQDTQQDRIVDGYMNAGYAIWREFAAEVIASSIDYRPAYPLSELKSQIKNDIRELHALNPSAKTTMVNLLTDIVFSEEAASSDWPALEAVLQKYGISFCETIGNVFMQLQREPFYRITPDFVFRLGTTYLRELTENTLGVMR